MWPFGKNKQIEVSVTAPDVWAPLSGHVLELSEVADPVFANGLLGPGLAILPASGVILSPFDGEVISLFPTGHAIGLRSAAGVECLIHCGIDTVELQGRGFKVDVHLGEKVKRGTRLIEMDLKILAQAGKSLLTPVVITNSDQWNVQIMRKDGEVVAGEDVLFRVVPAVSAVQSEP